ncbi:MAG: hypothetical protein NC207_07345 [Bacteroides sp.]|nr:hypothetical protein [Bacteroides sp.]
MGAIANPMFYIFLALGLVCVFDNRIWRGPAIKKFGWMYALMVLLIVYEFIIGTEYINQRTLLYLISRIVTFVIIISGLNYNQSFYCGKAIKWFIITMSFFLLFGLASGGFADSSGRMLAGYTNANTAGSMGAVIVGMVVFHTKGKRWSKLDYLCVFAGMFGVLASGSRAGFLMLGLLVFLRYGINVKTVGMCSALLILGLFVLPQFGIETVGIQRMLDTINGVEGTNRDIERMAAEWMIEQKPMTGWGFQAVNQGYAAEISELPSHNGYLEITKQMGFPCAIAYFFILASVLFMGVRAVWKMRIRMSLFLAIAIVLALDANYEALFVGVHEYVTNLFFFSMCMVSSSIYRLRR